MKRLEKVMNDIEFLENNIIAIFLTDSSTHNLIKTLDNDFFITEQAKNIFRVIKELFLDKQEINIVTVNNKLTTGKGKSHLPDLVAITDNVLIYTDINNYINKLKDIHIRAKIQKAIVNTARELKNSEIDSLEIKNNLIKELSKISDSRDISKAESIQDSLIKTLDTIEKCGENKDNFDLYTGFFDLDKLTDGLHENELTAIGARPGIGKTAFAINIGVNIAKRGKKVYFCSLEMSSEQITQRIIANYCSINTQFLRNW